MIPGRRTRHGAVPLRVAAGAAEGRGERRRGGFPRSPSVQTRSGSLTNGAHSRTNIDPRSVEERQKRVATLLAFVLLVKEYLTDAARGLL